MDRHIDTASVAYWWNRFMDTCFGEEREKLELAIGNTLRSDRELGKTYILVGKCGTGKTTILNLVYLLFQNDTKVCISWEGREIPHYKGLITFMETNRLDESKVLEGDVVIHTTGNRMPLTDYRNAMDIFQKEKLWIAQHCLCMTTGGNLMDMHTALAKLEGSE